MPGILKKPDGNRKRKRIDEGAAKTKQTKPRKAPKTANGDDAQAQILLLEEQILESREHYNNIVKLQELANNAEQKPKTATLAAVALCRVFCRLVAGESLVKRNGASEADAQVVQWLKQRMRDYATSLGTWIGSPDATKESTALTLLMRIVKEEASQEGSRGDQAWRATNSSFFKLVSVLLEKDDAEGARQEFANKYVEEHDDVRFYTFAAVKQYFFEKDNRTDSRIDNALELLSQIEGVPESEDELEDFYAEPPAATEKKHALRSLQSHRKAAQEAWLQIFRAPLSHDQRKRILAIMTRQVLPWFITKLEILTDFLTDSFNSGGGTALLALSGLFQLMTTKNIDYPDFYTKLYSLLDADILHSKHRSRFFRLFETFMASTHLPAALVASFIKRLARLALQAPPGAIVWIVPWTYNMLRAHPSCTFMLHRSYHPSHAIYAANPAYATGGKADGQSEAEDQHVEDIFSPSEPDPMLTHAIDSSLWELETLSSHYHPNVATLAKIVSEQFTKRDYTLEDFLDHSYATLIEAELGKVMKKAPVVEFEIPKRIVTTDEEGGGLNGVGELLKAAIEVS